MSVSGAFSGGSSKSTQQAQSQQTSDPVINQQALDALMQNAQQAQSNVGAAGAPYTGALTAGLTPQQQQASSLLQMAPGMGQGTLNSGILAALNGTQYQAPQINAGAYTAATANPGLTSATGYNPVSANAAMTGPAATANWTNAGMIDPNSISRVNAGGIAGGMSAFMNPYINSVVNATDAMQNQQRDQALMGNAQQATEQGAYGGDRLGVMDALTKGQYDLNTGLINSNLYSQGFNTAMTGATNQAQNNQAASTANAANSLAQAIANQNTSIANAQGAAGTSAINAGAQNTANLFNAGNAQQANLVNAGAANTAGAFGAEAQNAANTTNAGNIQQANLTNAGAQNTASQSNLLQQLQAQIANQGASATAAGINLNAGGLLGTLGNAQSNNFLAGTSALNAAGTQAQDTNQAYLSNLYSQYLQQQQYTLNGQQLINQSLGLVPAVLGQSSQGTSNSTGKSNAWNFGQSGSFGI